MSHPSKHEVMRAFQMQTILPYAAIGLTPQTIKLLLETPKEALCFIFIAIFNMLFLLIVG